MKKTRRSISALLTVVMVLSFVLSAIVMMPVASAAEYDLGELDGGYDLNGTGGRKPRFAPEGDQVMVSFDVTLNMPASAIICVSDGQKGNASNANMVALRFPTPSAGLSGLQYYEGTQTNRGTSFEIHTDREYAIKLLIDFSTKTFTVYARDTTVDGPYLKVAENKAFFVGGSSQWASTSMAGVGFIVGDDPGNGVNIYNVTVEDYTLTDPVEGMGAATIVYDANLGTGTTPLQVTKIAGDDVKLSMGAAMVAPVDKVLKAWNTKADGTGKSYALGSTISMFSVNTTLYAEWAEMYDITVDTVDDGTISVIGGLTSAFAGDKVTINTMPTTGGYGLKPGSLTVTGDTSSSIIPLNGKTFVMPDEAVTITAEFEEANNILFHIKDTDAMTPFGAEVISELKTMKVGETYDVGVFVQNIDNAGEITIPFKFDPTILQITGITLGTALTHYGYESLGIAASVPDESMYVYGDGTTDFDLSAVNTAGMLAFIFGTTDTDPQISAMGLGGIEEKFRFVTITFEAIAPSDQFTHGSITAPVTPVIQESRTTVTGGFQNPMLDGAAIYPDAGIVGGPGGAAPHNPIFPEFDITDIRVIGDVKIEITDRKSVV